MILSLIAAVADNNVIGRDGGLPWRIPSELQYFKQTTLGRPVIMGRKTFQSLKRPLPGRQNIVVTRDAAFHADGISVARNLDAALQAAGAADEVFVIGGATLYAEALPRAQRLYLTRVHLSPAGDTFFPPLDPAAWRLARSEERAAQTGDEAPYTLTVLEKL